MDVHTIIEEGKYTLVPETSTVVSFTEPETLTILTELKDRVGLRFTDKDKNIQVRVILSTYTARVFLNKLAETLGDS